MSQHLDPDEENIRPNEDLDMPVSRQRTVYEVGITMETYIGEPYWPEINACIDIRKKSGVDRARSEATRAAALKAYLEKEGITSEEYAALELRTKRPWYRLNPQDDTSEIIIPRHCIQGCLVEATKRSPSSVIKTGLAENLRTILQVSDWATGKYESDRVFRRYIKHPDTNQRRYQESQVVENFQCSGTVAFDVNEIAPKTIHTLIRWALANVGIGGARKMAYGRGDLTSFSTKH